MGTATRRFSVRRKRVCKFCAEKITYIDFKDGRLLSHFNPERGKILPRRISGVCAVHQRQLLVNAALWSAGLTHQQRKARRDRVAAQILLQSYLDAGCPSGV